MKLRKKLGRELVLISVRFATVLAHLLPWKWGAKLGGGLGIAAFYLLRKERERTISHLSLAFGKRLTAAEQYKTARASFAHLGTGFFEVLNLPRLNKNNLDEIVEMRGEENLSKAFSQGKGIIFIGGHIGNWELMALTTVLKGVPLKVVAAPIYDPRLDTLMSDHRARHGIETIRRGSPRVARQILSGLRRGYMLAFLIDQDTEVEGAYVDFFDHPAYTPTGAVALALHSGAPVLTGYARRLSDGRHQVVFEGPVDLIRGKDRKEEILSNTALLTKQIEGYIRECPEQWVWIHRRWAKGSSRSTRQEAGRHA